MLKDEGYQSALDCTTYACKHVENSLLEMEESYKQQIRDLEFELELQYKLIEKNNEIKNKLIDDNDDDELVGKGKGGKGYVEKMCNLEEEQLMLREQYLSKIKSEKKYLRFQQLDDETQLMICKIDALRESGIGNNFFGELLGMFERKSMELEKLKKTVEEMKELEEDYAMTINKLVDDHEKVIEEKDQEINCLKKQLQAALIGKVRRGYLGEPSRIKSGRKDVKFENLDDECQLMIANIEALRESDNMIYGKVIDMLEQQSQSTKM